MEEERNSEVSDEIKQAFDDYYAGEIPLYELAEIVDREINQHERSEE